MENTDLERERGTCHANLGPCSYKVTADGKALEDCIVVLGKRLQSCLHSCCVCVSSFGWISPSQWTWGEQRQLSMRKTGVAGGRKLLCSCHLCVCVYSCGLRQEASAHNQINRRKAFYTNGRENEFSPLPSAIRSGHPDIFSVNTFLNGHFHCRYGGYSYVGKMQSNCIEVHEKMTVSWFITSINSLACSLWGHLQSSTVKVFKPAKISFLQFHQIYQQNALILPGMECNLYLLWS